jgi:NAD(P)-dependent dehydrogenase (short-subunit alcohol dehydrogenase family)
MVLIQAQDTAVTVGGVKNAVGALENVKIMKFAITGHTKGLGAALTQQLSYGHSVLGFSKSTGYNITNKEDRTLIIDQSFDCHVFINNAHSGYSQTELLYELWERWKDLDKLIVNISSNTTDGIKLHPHRYTAEKIALEKANEQLANLKNTCKVSIYKFGWIGTERVITNYKPEKYIMPDDAASFIINTIMQTHKHRLASVTLLP